MYCETCWRHVISMVPTWCSHQNEACSNFNDFCGHAADQPWVSVKRCVDGSPGCCSYLNTFFFMHCRSLSAIRKRKAARARLSPESSKPTPFRPRPASRGPSLHPLRRLDPEPPSNKSLLRTGQVYHKVCSQESFSTPDNMCQAGRAPAVVVSFVVLHESDQHL
jgi:hypothetical protein